MQTLGLSLQTASCQHQMICHFLSHQNLTIELCKLFHITFCRCQHCRHISLKLCLVRVISFATCCLTRILLPMKLLIRSRLSLHHSVIAMDLAMGAANSYVLMYYDKYKHVQVTDGHLSLQDLPLVPITKGKKSYKEFFQIVRGVPLADQEAIRAAIRQMVRI